ncbi:MULTISPECIES: cryptochrome/photolyase family protein [Pseudoxanthomonas]|uniref:cryptochrome/photolyase family protein n=1 Tax=Pseudoxanthomonas TaxID=83618 RepID=UPI00197F6B2D|nr:MULTISPECIES: cryptochrome/photolyase family protein [Pseudoxanthomonas]UAY75093.1 cryptochrome/photolyase family protein [Pseudoxanthomonas sp. X-1]
MAAGPGVRHLVVVLGDQLDPDSAALHDFDPDRDAVWMAEVAHEASHVWSTQPRIALFLAAMRHFRDALRARGWRVEYRALDTHDFATLEDALAHDLAALRPDKVIAVRPGEWRLAQSLPQVAATAGVDWRERPDLHFFCDPADFADWARGRRELRMEHFYRWIRRRENVLMDGAQPVAGRWNFDADNRGSFGKAGPQQLPAPAAFPPDAVTGEVIALVRARFGDRPGDLSRFDWPLTPAQARQALEDFIALRLPHFGRYQDAMWTDQPWLFHALLSAAMNLKLLSPRVVVEVAVRAWRDGQAPIEAVEGFVRQVIGWREFVRGVYWLRMPAFAQDNALDAQQPLPAFYWDGRTHMVCMRQTLQQTLQLGYAHHIQRLMVTGAFALMLGVAPAQIHAWYLAVYVDAVEWVELPNTLGMSQFADGGRMVSKPYAASGRYIQRMSNYCQGCRYDPGVASGEDACPFTTLYWDFLMRHARRFADHPRAALQWRSLERLDEDQRAAIAARAAQLRALLAPAADG